MYADQSQDDVLQWSNPKICDWVDFKDLTQHWCDYGLCSDYGTQLK